MYSVVLLVSLTGAPEAPNFGGRLFGGGHGCNSSCTGCWSSCSGSGCWSSCSGAGCTSSCGGAGCWSSCHGTPVVVRSGCWSSCHGIRHSSGCWSTSCNGCYGTSCTGCYGTYSCHGYGIYGGTSYSWPTPYYGGCGGCYGTGYPAVPVYVEIRKETIKEVVPKKMTSLPVAPDRARVIVNLPADAKLYANGQPTTLTSAERDFMTPALELGREFQYSLKVEYIRDGKTITDDQIVRVRAGEVSTIEFVDRAKTEVASSTVKVSLPEGAKLFIDDQPRTVSQGSVEFQTPQLVKGAEYTYTFRAELTKEGKNLTETKRIVFKAGELITVNFKEMDASRTAAK